ncbi:MAG: hypothetical protein KME26_00940 [Oscillatoria princeps RMCB-10]|jgi:ornithine cyclodeaminase/alanine dehydrogenase-like protein (mu-crystallin family)|nr:hypothetical protein [Oscillatoria princeps RMCB-10]
MPEERRTYKNREILIKTDDSEPQLLISGKQIDVARDAASGRYSTSYLPYEDYESIEELAKDVIDYVPSFKRDLGN